MSVEGAGVENDWKVWLYPREADTAPPEGVHVTSALDEAAEQVLAKGGTVLALLDPDRVSGGVITGFSPVFWNTAWTNDMPPQTLGVLVDPDHPLFTRFPTEYHSDWQWWELTARAGALVIDDLPPGLEPLVRPIDTWFRSHRLALLFEARVGQGGA